VRVQGAQIALESGRGAELPTTIVKVMDNCTYQNKQNTTAMFDMAMSIIFGLRIVNLFLKPGHSHMQAVIEMTYPRASSYLSNRNPGPGPVP
jgi:hypothetical protein